MNRFNQSSMLRTKTCASIFLMLLVSGTVQFPVLAQSSPATVEMSAESSNPSYILGAGDQVSITVFGYQEYTGAQVILPDGTIKLPLLEPVQAAGKTTEQLAQELTNRLQPLLVDPSVTVSLTSLRPVVVNVAGEVQRPGPVQLRSLTAVAAAAAANPATPTASPSGTSAGAPVTPAQTTLTIADALVAAGGITRNADIRKVVIKRNGPNGASLEKTVNLWDAVVSNSAFPNIVLQDGDSLYIPRLMAGDTVDRRLIARTRYAPSTVRVRVVGEVKDPGEIQVSPDSSISSALAIAGGPTRDAKLSQVAYIRLNESGQVDRQIIDLRNLTDNYQVQEGDVVIVPKKSDASFIDGLARVVGPVGGVLNILKAIFGF